MGVRTLVEGDDMGVRTLVEGDDMGMRTLVEGDDMGVMTTVVEGDDMGVRTLVEGDDMGVMTTVVEGGDRAVHGGDSAAVSSREEEWLRVGGVPPDPRQVHQHVRRSRRTQEHEGERQERLLGVPEVRHYAQGVWGGLGGRLVRGLGPFEAGLSFIN